MNIQLSPISALFIASVALLVIGLIATPPMKEAQATMTTSKLIEQEFPPSLEGGIVLVVYESPTMVVLR
jgi:hypothetical protein